MSLNCHLRVFQEVLFKLVLINCFEFSLVFFYPILVQECFKTRILAILLLGMHSSLFMFKLVRVACFSF